MLGAPSNPKLCGAAQHTNQPQVSRFRLCFPFCPGAGVYQGNKNCSSGTPNHVMVGEQLRAQLPESSLALVRVLCLQLKAHICSR